MVNPYEEEAEEEPQKEEIQEKSVEEKSTEDEAEADKADVVEEKKDSNEPKEEAKETQE
jgi:hypothetical protein